MALGLRETPHPQTTSPPHRVAVSRLGLHKRVPEDCGFRPAGPWPPGYGKLRLVLRRGGTEPLWRRPRTPARAGRAGYSHMLSCRTKLAMLLCLKYLGSTSLANWPWSNTWKLFPLCWETRRSHVPPAREARPERLAAHIPSCGGGRR